MMTHGRGGSDLWGSSLSDSSSEAVVMHGAFITTPTALVLRPTDVAARSGASRRAWFAGEIFTGSHEEQMYSARALAYHTQSVDKRA